jgi:hypothetical protein
LIRVIWAIILLVPVFLVPTGQTSADETFPTTTFVGRVTDIDTGDPIFNATVYIRNYTMEAYFFGQTDEQGIYSIQVGKGGIYVVDVMHDVYEFVTTESDISTWEEKRLDLRMRHYENNCNIMVEKDGRFLPFYNAIVELVEVPNGSFYRLRSDIDGWANITIPPGNYTLTAYAPHYRASIRSIDIGTDDYCFTFVSIGPESVSKDAPNILIDETYTIPSRSAFVLGIVTEEEYSLYFQFRSDRRVSSYTVPGENLESFLNWTKGIPVDNSSIPLYDGALLDGRNGGMTYSTWTDPCHIVIVNNGTDPTKVQVTLKYEYGTFDLIEPSFISLDKEEKDNLRWIEIKAGPAIASFFLLMIGLIIIIVYFGIRRDRKENATRMSDPRYGRGVRRRSSLKRDRSSPPYRYDGDRSYR